MATRSREAHNLAPGNSDYRRQEASSSKPGQLELKGIVARAREQERARIALEIHDGVAQILTAALLESQAALVWLTSDHSRVAVHLEAVQGLLRQMQSELRNVLYDLHSRDARADDFIGALREQIARVQSVFKLSCELDVRGPQRGLTQLQMVNLLHIVQESMNNAVKHAEASQLHVSVRYEPEALIVLVSDDGKGFDITDEAIRGPQHFGITGIRERAEQIGARVKISSRRGYGTDVTISLPLPVGQT